MIKSVLLSIVLTIAAGLFADETQPKSILFRESFDDANLSQRDWYDGTEFRIAGDSFAGPGCIEYEWLDVSSKVSGSSGTRHSFEPTDEVYLRFYLKLSKGWGWTGRNYHPHLLHFMTTENSKWHGPAGSHLTLYVEPVNGKLRLAATDIQNKDSPHGLTQGPLKGGFNGVFFDSTEELFKDDQWHCIEACFKLNTLDLKNDRPNRDGVVRGWFDGKLVIEQSDVILRSTDFPAMKFNQFLMTPYFGTGLLPHAQRLWIDELVVSTNRVGPLTAAVKVPHKLEVVLYRDKGSNDRGVAAVQKALTDREDIVVTLQDADGIRTGDWPQHASVVIFSGGLGSVQSKTLGEEGEARIRQFIDNGGGYIGICAGAYLACDGRSYGLRVLDAKTVSSKWNRGRGDVQIEVTELGSKILALPAGKRLLIQYANGPIYKAAANPQLPDFETLAYFRTELAQNGTPPGIMIDSPAMVAGQFGRGRVLCSSAHPERTLGMETWVERAVRWAAGSEAH